MKEIKYNIKETNERSRKLVIDVERGWEEGLIQTVGGRYYEDLFTEMLEEYFPELKIGFGKIKLTDKRKFELKEARKNKEKIISSQIDLIIYDGEPILGTKRGTVLVKPEQVIAIIEWKKIHTKNTSVYDEDKNFVKGIIPKENMAYVVGVCAERTYRKSQEKFKKMGIKFFSFSSQTALRPRAETIRDGELLKLIKWIDKRIEKFYQGEKNEEKINT